MSTAPPRLISSAGVSIAASRFGSMFGMPPSSRPDCGRVPSILFDRILTSLWPSRGRMSLRWSSFLISTRSSLEGMILASGEAFNQMLVECALRLVRRRGHFIFLSLSSAALGRSDYFCGRGGGTPQELPSDGVSGIGEALRRQRENLHAG